MLVRFVFALLLAAYPTGLLECGNAVAKDYFLTIGGGYDPTGNQLSLERNVVFQQAVLDEQRPDKPVHDVYFADGNDDARDLQCRDPDFKTKCPAARRIMAEVFGDADSMDLVYRNHEIQSERGPTELPLLRRRLRELARELKAGDRLIIYVTGHGSGADRPYNDDYDYEYDEDSGSWKASDKHDESEDAKTEYNEHDTSFYLWDSESVSASQFSRWLDRFHGDVEVVLVMVQCYAGGFAHTIFRQADANLGLSSHARCGFFAQVHDRGAAGCTADANEADYEEYSSYFWGALGGRTRIGETITSADYDGDGKVSFAEAHSYAVLESDTIDIPVRTSSAFLQKFSSRGKASDDSDEEESGSSLGRFLNLLGSDKKPVETKHQLIELQGPLSELLGSARPDQRAILEKLPAKLGLTAAATVEEVKRRLKQVDSDGKVASTKLAAAAETQSSSLQRVQEDLREIWPELNATYAPLSMELTSDRAQEFVDRVSSMPAYQALREATEQQTVLSEEQMKLAREEARLQRLLHTCEDIVRAANLAVVAPAELVARYERLLAMEERTLVP